MYFGFALTMMKKYFFQKLVTMEINFYTVVVELFNLQSHGVSVYLRFSEKSHKSVDNLTYMHAVYLQVFNDCSTCSMMMLNDSLQAAYKMQNMIRPSFVYYIATSLIILIELLSNV